MTYDPATYWGKRGMTYAAEARRAGTWAAEDVPLIDLLKRLTFSSVLDLGCGYGRVAQAIARLFPKVAYTGVDVSPHLTEVTRDRVPTAEIIVADIATWESDRRWDLVLAANVLGHIRPADLARVWAKIEAWARRDIIHIDWNEVGASTPYQYGHDYDRLPGHSASSRVPMGATTMYHLSLP